MGLVGQEEGFCSVKGSWYVQSVSQNDSHIRKFSKTLICHFQKENKPFRSRNERITPKKNLIVKTVEIGKFNSMNFRL